MKKYSKNKGFTLIELLVVITIIGILASLAVPAISGAIKSANQTKDVNNIRQLGIMLTMDANDNGGTFRTKSSDGTTDASSAIDIYYGLVIDGVLTDLNVLCGNGDTPTKVTGDLSAMSPGDIAPTNAGFSYVSGMRTTSNGSLPLLITKETIDDSFGPGEDIGQEITIAANTGPWEGAGVAIYRVGGNANFAKTKAGKIEAGKVGTGKYPADTATRKIKLLKVE